MTDLKDGLITELLLNDAAYNPEVQALAYALQKEKSRIMDFADRTRTMAMIEQLPETVLDVLAVEMRTPYYKEDLTVDQKRNIIQNTLVWFYKAGTPSAVRELISTLFGEGDVVEWFNFEDDPKTPGTFDIVTPARMTADIIERFMQIINKIKNTRSHVRTVKVVREEQALIYIGSAVRTSPKIVII